MTPQEIGATLASTFGDAIVESKLDGVLDPFARVSPVRIKEIALFLRDNDRMQFDTLMCLSGLDYTGGKFGVVYHLASTPLGHKFVLKVDLTSENMHVESVESVWKTANWHEREAFDMYGIIFDNHPDLRRILMPDDWVGYPLRKDYQVPEFYNGMKVPY
jgi:NADH-quinone oxidoreductase subunit C